MIFRENSIVGTNLGTDPAADAVAFDIGYLFNALTNLTDGLGQGHGAFRSHQTLDKYRRFNGFLGADRRALAATGTLVRLPADYIRQLF